MWVVKPWIDYLNAPLNVGILPDAVYKETVIKKSREIAQLFTFFPSWQISQRTTSSAPISFSIGFEDVICLNLKDRFDLVIIWESNPDFQKVLNDVLEAKSNIQKYNSSLKDCKEIWLRECEKLKQIPSPCVVLVEKWVISFLSYDQLRQRWIEVRFSRSGK